MGASQEEVQRKERTKNSFQLEQNKHKNGENPRRFTATRGWFGCRAVLLNVSIALKLLLLLLLEKWVKREGTAKNRSGGNPFQVRKAGISQGRFSKKVENGSRHILMRQICFISKSTHCCSESSSNLH